MAERIILAQLDLDTQSLVKSAMESGNAIKALRAEQKLLKDSGEENSAQYVRNEAELKRLTAQRNQATKAIAAQVNESDRLVSAQEKATEAISKEVVTIDEAIANNKELRAVRNTLNLTTEEGKKKLAEINAKLDANTEFVRENGSALEQQKMNIGNYKDSIVEAANELNIFNGGIGGFIARSQEAGGIGPMVTSSLKAMASGIMGMTKAALAFMATPLGIVLTAVAVVVGLVSAAFKTVKPLMDKVEQAGAAVGAVFNVLKNVFIAIINPAKSLSDAFSGLGGRMSEAAKSAADLKKAQQDLEDAMESQEVASASARAEIDKLNTQAKDRTKTEEERLALLQKAEKLEKEDYAARKKNADEALRQAQEQIRIDAELTKEEFAQLQLRGQDYKEYVEEKSGDVDELFKTLKDAQLKSIQLDSEYNVHLEKNINRQNKLFEDAEKEREKQSAAAEKSREDAERARQEREQKAQEAHDKEIERMQQRLELETTLGNQRAKSLSEQIALAENLSKKEIDILKKELQYKKISQAQYEKGVIESRAAMADKIAQLTLQYGNAEINLWAEKNKSLVEGNEKLNQSLLDQEENRLKQYFGMQLNLLEKEKQTDLAKIEAKRANNEELTVLDMEYLTRREQLETETNERIEANKKALKEQQQAALDEQLIFQREKSFMDAKTDYERKVLEEDERRIAEQEKVKAWYDQDKISYTEFQNYKSQIDEDSAKRKTNLLLQQRSTELGAMQAIANGMGEAFGQSKELSIAQANMKGAQAILSIWSGEISGNPLIDTIIKGVLTATTAITTAKQIQNIKQAKKPSTPRFEAGGLQMIGGNRHSSGGTLFTGADGTRFEAEQGELIGVMNRNAAHHFMAFNNAFPAGGASAGNYFANGGIVSREMGNGGMNVLEFANATAEAVRQMPRPVVAVEEIITVSRNVVEVKNTSEF